jgi:hypothetical protein
MPSCVAGVLAKVRSSNLATLLILVCAAATLGSGCGGQSADRTTSGSRPDSTVVSPGSDSSEDTANTAESGNSGPKTVGNSDERTTADTMAEGELPDAACEALTPDLARAFDRRVHNPVPGGSLDICGYGTNPEAAVQLIFEFVPPGAEPSEAVAKAVCGKLIKEPLPDDNNSLVSQESTSSDPPALLGSEALLYTVHEHDKTGYGGDTTVYVADWREGGNCATLISSTEEPAEPPPLSKFTALASALAAGGTD